MFLKFKPLINPQTPAALAGFEQAASLRADRQQEAEEDYLTGLAKLQQAETNGFEDKRMVLVAYRHLATAIHKHRSEPRYHSAMAYLLVLVGNSSRAIRYVAEALRLDPAHEQAIMLQQQIQRIQTASPERLRLASWYALQDSPQPQDSDDFDQLYDEVEAFIAQEVRTMMQLSVSPEATLDLELAQEQARYYEQLEALHEMLHSKLALLDQEIETQSLMAMLQPLQLLQKRFEMALEHHTLFHLLLDGIEGALEDAQVLQGLLQMGENVPQQELDALLDLCDELADQLDDLSEHQGLRPVEAHYEMLIREIEILQDRMDSL